MPWLLSDNGRDGIYHVLCCSRSASLDRGQEGSLAIRCRPCARISKRGDDRFDLIDAVVALSRCL